MKPTDICSSEVSIAKKKKKKSHLPNSRITAQTRRALSTSPRFEPKKFTKDIVDCRFLRRIMGRKKEKEKEKE